MAYSNVAQLYNPVLQHRASVRMLYLEMLDLLTTELRKHKAAGTKPTPELLGQIREFRDIPLKTTQGGSNGTWKSN